MLWDQAEELIGVRVEISRGVGVALCLAKCAQLGDGEIRWSSFEEFRTGWEQLLFQKVHNSVGREG